MTNWKIHSCPDEVTSLMAFLLKVRISQNLGQVDYLGPCYSCAGTTVLKSFDVPILFCK